MSEIKTLADFKRALSRGTLWHLYHCIDGKSKGLREVAIVQSKAVAFKLPDAGDDPKKFSWLQFQPAKRYSFYGDTVLVMDDFGTPVLRYTRIGRPE